MTLSLLYGCMGSSRRLIIETINFVYIVEFGLVARLPDQISLEVRHLVKERSWFVKPSFFFKMIFFHFLNEFVSPYNLSLWLHSLLVFIISMFRSLPQLIFINFLYCLIISFHYLNSLGYYFVSELLINEYGHIVIKCLSLGEGFPSVWDNLFIFLLD